MYAVPRPNPPLVKMATVPAISRSANDIDHDYVEPPIELTSEDPDYYRVPRIHSSMSDTTSNKWNGSVYSPPPPSEDSTTAQQRDSGSSGGDPQIFPEREDVGGGIYNAVPEESSHYEMETTEAPDSAVPVYQNTDNVRAEAEAFKSSRSNSTELLSVTGGTSQAGSGSVSPLTTSPPPQTHTRPSSDPSKPLTTTHICIKYILL